MEENFDVGLFVRESGNTLPLSRIGWLGSILFLHPHDFNLI